MSFSRPEYLAAIPLVIGLLWLAQRMFLRRVRRLAQAYGEHAVGRILPADAPMLRHVRLGSLTVAGVALCLAAAGPGETPAGRVDAPPPLDIVVVVDVSISMGAADIAPTRIQRAGDVVARLGDASPTARVGLLVVGDWPYTLAPLTDDHELVRYFARSLNGSLVSSLASSIRTSIGDRGASVRSAIEQARSVLGPAPGRRRQRVILLISDGAVSGDRDEALAAASDAAKAGVAVWTAGVGTAHAPTLEIGGRPAFDASGDPITAQFDAALLRSLAKSGGGTYRDVSGDSGARALISDVRALGGLSAPEDVGPERFTFWLLLLAMALLAAEGGLAVGHPPALRRWIEARS